MNELNTTSDVLNALSNPNVTVRLTAELFGKTTRELIRSADLAYDLPASDLFAEYGRIHNLATRLSSAEVVGDADRITAQMYSVDALRMRTSSAAAFEIVARRIMTPEQIAQIVSAQQ